MKKIEKLQKNSLSKGKLFFVISGKKMCLFAGKLEEKTDNFKKNRRAQSGQGFLPTQKRLFFFFFAACKIKTAETTEGRLALTG